MVPELITVSVYPQVGETIIVDAIESSGLRRIKQCLAIWANYYMTVFTTSRQPEIILSDDCDDPIII